MPLNTYDVGDLATIQAEFQVNTGTISTPIWTPTDPTEVTCDVRSPSGTVTSYEVAIDEIVNDETGVYHLDLPVTEEGDWWYRFIGTGDVQATQEGGFLAVDQRVAEPILNPNALTSLSRARAYVLGNATTDSEDDKLAFLINWASEAIQNYAQREFSPTPLEIDSNPNPAATRKFDYVGGGYLSLAPYELRTVDEISLYSDTGTPLTLGANDYRLEPRGATRQGTYLSLELLPATRGLARLDFGYEVTISGDWGMAAVPADVEGACLIMVKDLRVNPGAFQSYNVGPVQVSQGDLLPTIPYGSVPPGARKALAPYLRNRAFGTIKLSRPFAIRRYA